MITDIRSQRKCYFASVEYSRSFWGKYIFLFEGSGSLRLTEDSLNLEDCAQAVEIPFKAIKSITIGRFSSWSKPTGLNYLALSYFDEEYPKQINLIPYESALDSTLVTNEIITSWQETLLGVEELTNRVQTPVLETESPRTFGKGLVLAATVVMPLAILGVGLVCFLLFQR